MSVKSVNEVIVNKVKTLMAFNRVINRLIKCEKIVKSVSVNPNKVLTEVNNKCVKMCRISTECNALDRNQDKCKSYKHFICFWPKCHFSSYNISELDHHIISHTNEKSFKWIKKCFSKYLRYTELYRHLGQKQMKCLLDLHLS